MNAVRPPNFYQTWIVGSMMTGQAAARTLSRCSEESKSRTKTPQLLRVYMCIAILTKIPRAE
eukprot:jgi/Picsp_1/887/NSC_04374-R1_---NA---